MPHSTPGPLTLRLLACCESFAHEEEGAIGHDDWPALAAVLKRESAVVARLAREGEASSHSPTEPDPGLLARARALHARHAALERRVAEARDRVLADLEELKAGRRRLRAVNAAYGSARAA